MACNAGIDPVSRMKSPGMVPTVHRAISKMRDPLPTSTRICLLMTLMSRPSRSVGPVISSSSLAIHGSPKKGALPGR
jgi:hypothetical protein